ncbi:SGNH hydrolase [Leptospira kobayashii]|uniref:SGNH hydrolase n=1 Tax=Leptospira kobayashii TaxID=1917830 RepID=A0ABM7UMU2_9LEPT|nr:GDSL-type esterase/lipase family protein [Leptospira kobayashii]BDA80272.1 SGNH hydrolase [Leptospira kobayashii]
MFTHIFRFLSTSVLSAIVFYSLLWPTRIAAEPLGVKQSASIPIIRQFGDSITYGYGYVQCYGTPGICMGTTINGGQIQQCMTCAVYMWGGGYRGWMTELALQPSNQFGFATVGYQCGGSYTSQWQTNSMSHDGYPGFRTDQLVPIAMLPSVASITLVHAGTNDFAQGKSVDWATQNLTQIVKNLIQQSGNGTIYVAKIVRFMKPAASCTKCTDNTVLNPLVKTYNEWIDQKLANAIGTKFSNQVVIVDMYDALTLATDYSFDGVHPSPAGYQKMACSWIRAIKKMPSLPENPCSGFTFGETKSQTIPSESDLQKSLPQPEFMNRILQGKLKGASDF